MANIRTLQGTLALGNTVAYTQTYTPSLLCSLPRSDGRATLELENHALPFEGVDIWTAYELSWLDLQGKPIVACGIFYFPCQAPGMIESKSFKLYLNSFNQTRFSSFQDVKKTLVLDLSFAVQDSVEVEIYPVRDFSRLCPVATTFPGVCIDDLAVAISEYHVNPALLLCADPPEIIQEMLHSHLLKTNCPVTGQPDWASICIHYRGPRIQREALLKYLCSYRLEADFHEQCIERVFRDLQQHCRCERLTIEGRYVRRGGLDINPFRSNCGEKPQGLRLARQ
jgi:7-cyano-7-deazaguanine reductase